MSSVTFTAPPSRPRRGSSVTDAVLAAAVDVARSAALEAAGADDVGDHQDVAADGQRLATHYFACTAPAYRGWRWAVTLARAPRAKVATVCEVSLQAGDGAVQAPPWVPWSERLQPGDVGREDVLPYSADDARLMAGYAATGDVDADALALYELGLGRPRVLSPEGRAQAATRWYDGEHGPVDLDAATGGRRSGGSGRRGARVVAQCSTCGFLMLMAGSLRTVFGVCSNEWSPDDGKVVSMDHGCGAHSETDVLDGRRDWPDNAPVVDDHALELVESGPSDGPAPGAPAADTAASSGESGGETGPERTAEAPGPTPGSPEAGTEPESAGAGTEPEPAHAPARPPGSSEAGTEPESADAPGQAPGSPEAGAEPESADAPGQAPGSPEAGTEPESADAPAQPPGSPEAGTEPESADAPAQAPGSPEAGTERERAQEPASVPPVPESGSPSAPAEPTPAGEGDQGERTEG